MPWKPKQHRPPGSARGADRARHDRARARRPQQRALNTRAWRRFSALIRTQRPTCEDCLREPSTQVHHVRGLGAHPEDLCDPEQVRALCQGCHSRLTAKGE